MASFGSGLLDLLGMKDPRAGVLGSLQLGGQGAGQPGSTPPGTPPGAAAPTPAAPAQPTAYTSPPELLSLYNDLLGRQERENRINSGMGLIGSSFARPENRAGIMAAMTGGGSSESPSDTLNLVMQMNEMQKADEAAAVAAQDKDRQLGMIPALSQEYGLSPEAARLLFDNGGLDDFVQEAAKPDVEIKEAQDGSIMSINKKTNETKILSKGFGPNSDTQSYEVDMQDREARGEARIPVQQWMNEDANRKAPKTVINNNPMGTGQADQKLMEAFDTSTNEAFTKAQAGVTTIATVQEARRAMQSEGGIIGGDITAPVRVEAVKMLGTLFPGFDTQAATNTEVMNSELKRLVLPRVKELGTGNSISNADREYIEKMIGNSVLTPEALGRIMDITERGERREIAKANERMQARVDAAAPDSPLRKVFQPIPVPDLSQEYIQSTLKNVDQADLTMIVQGRDDMGLRAEFEKAYGPGSSRDIIEAATGMDPGPLRAATKSSGAKNM